MNSTYVTLDGVIEDPQDWPVMGGFSDAGNDVQTNLMERADAVLMGRRTYESFAPVWSARSGDRLSDRMNAVTKYVVSTTLNDPGWRNTEVIDQAPLESIRALKRDRGGDIVQFGFGPLAHALMNAGLLDELRLWVHPFFVGTGTADHLLYRAGSSGVFEFDDCTPLPNGTAILCYRAAAT